MSDSIWLIIWMTILGAGLVGMAGLLLAVGTGSVRELRQTLDELRSEDGVDEPGESIEPVE